MSNKLFYLDLDPNPTAPKPLQERLSLDLCFTFHSRVTKDNLKNAFASLHDSISNEIQNIYSTNQKSIFAVLWQQYYGGDLPHLYIVIKLPSFSQNAVDFTVHDVAIEINELEWGIKAPREQCSICLLNTELTANSETFNTVNYDCSVAINCPAIQDELFKFDEYRKKFYRHTRKTLLDIRTGLFSALCLSLIYATFLAMLQEYGRKVVGEQAALDKFLLLIISIGILAILLWSHPSTLMILDRRSFGRFFKHSLQRISKMFRSWTH